VWVSRRRSQGIALKTGALDPTESSVKARPAASGRRMPLWLKIGTSFYVAVLVPSYWITYGPTNFLWFSDVALLVTAAALWLESSFLASMTAVGVLVPELLWSFDFLFRLLTGIEVTGGAAYMFNPEIPVGLRGLALFHLGLPLLLVEMLYRLGYDRHAWIAQTLLAWVIFPLSYLWSPPGENINVVRGFAWLPYDRALSSLGPVVAMVVAPLLLYLPTHLILSRIFANPAADRSA
jgi:hypothetical protein